MKALSIFLSALFTVATALSLGLLLFQRLRLRLSRQEQYFYAFGCGSAVLSLLVFIAAAAHLLWTATLVAIGVLSVGACVYYRAYRPFEERLDPVPRFYKLLMLVAMPAFALLYFAHALAPEGSPDGSTYHLGLVQQYLDQRGFGRITTDMYANLPLGMEMVYLFAFSLGRHSAAALVHFAFLLALPFLLVAIGQRFGFVRGGVVAGLLVFLSPVFGIDGSTAYIDVALTFIVVALFGLLQRWDESRDAALLPLIGLLAGFSYAVKPTAFTAVVYAFGFVLYKCLRYRLVVARPLFVVSACTTLMIAPWLIKNAITVVNPFSPFLNAWFPNPFMRISLEESYREYLRNYEGLKSYWDIPFEVTMRGAILNGFLGPVFLAVPLGLLALRWKLGRQAWLLGVLLLSTYPSNIGTRFLMPAAPFLALALGMVVTQSRGMGTLLVAFHAWTCWPETAPLYANQFAWRIAEYHWDAAFRRQPEAEYLNSKISGYAAAKLAEQHVPKTGVIFTHGGISQAYCRRPVWVAYQSAQGNRIGDYVAAAVLPAFQPTSWWTYSFAPQKVRRLRVVQTGATASKNVWSVSELRLFGTHGELQRSNGWTLRAQPAPWEVQYAFDNCPVTRWYSAEQAKPGMFVEVTLPEAVELSSVRIEATADQTEGTARLEAEVDGRWVVLVEKPSISQAVPMRGLRREAVLDMKREGVTHLSVQKDEYFANDIAADPSSWALTLLGETPYTRLYRLD
jgi:hypothetical protein